MRSMKRPASQWVCIGIVAASAAVMVGAGRLCEYVYALTSVPESDAARARCGAPDLVCLCEKYAKFTNPARSGSSKREYRVAECKCFQSPNPADYGHFSADASPGEGWVKLSPTDLADPDVVCWVRLSPLYDLRVIQQGYMVDKCETAPAEPRKDH